MRMEMTPCPAKHTKFQVDMKDFNCPRCKGQHGEDFYIADYAEGSDPDCELLHEQDNVQCSYCWYTASGKVFAARVRRNNASPEDPTGPSLPSPTSSSPSS